MHFDLTNDTIRQRLDIVCQQDKAIAAAIEKVGYPKERRNACGYPTLLRVISGQQLSVKAASTIHGRVEALMNGVIEPKVFMALDDEALRGAGLSWQKISYGRSLSTAVLEKTLPIDTLHEMDDEAAIDAICKVKGLGRWSAEMYMMFSLGRADIWPVDDLAVRVGIGRIKGEVERPTPKVVEAWGEAWRPYRSVIALLSWHYYSNAPL